jgi:hypothetical protein
MSESLRVGLLFVCCAFSLVWLGIGFVAPLTPSEGVPTAGEVALFYMLPLLICGSAYLVATKISEKIFTAIVFTMIVSAGAWVLSISYRATFVNTAAAKGDLMFPLPPDAKEAGHVVLAQGVSEEDYFWIRASFPETPALAHYSTLFKGWLECKPWTPGWEGRRDPSHGTGRYLHRFLRHWINEENNHSVMLLFQYESADLNYPQRPDNDRQFVAIVSDRVPDAAKHFAEINVDCPKAPHYQ